MQNINALSDRPCQVERLYSPKQLAELRGVSLPTITHDRLIGGGVPFMRIGRLIRYREREIQAWIDGHQSFTSTTEADAAETRKAVA